AEHGEVLRTHEHGATVDAPPAGDERVGGHRTDEGAELTEGARVEQVLDAFPRGQAAAVVLLRDLPGSAHLAGGLFARSEVIEPLGPLVHVHPSAFVVRSAHHYGA